MLEIMFYSCFLEGRAGVSLEVADVTLTGRRRLRHTAVNDAVCFFHNSQELGKTDHAFLPTGHNMTEMGFAPFVLLLLRRKKKN